MNKFALLLTLVLVTLILSACVSTGELAVTEPWARPGMSGGTSAAYFIIENPSSQADTLLKADADIAAAVEVHMTVPVGGDDLDEGMDGNDGEGKDTGHSSGMQGMKMIPVEKVDVPKGSVEFKPGGLHVMFIGLTDDLKAGENFTLTLTFEKAGTIFLSVPVKEN